jgi:CRP/FNR family cyclic AMP-dependent transcriptional regulator
MQVTENKVWYLKRSRLFDRASDEAVAGYEHLFTQITYRKRAVVFELGDVGRVVYFIKIGRVRIVRATADGKEITLAILGPGDLFGEEVIFAPDVVRSTVATCLEDTLLCTARAVDLYGIMARHPVLAVNVAKYLHEQRDDALSIAEDLAYLKIPDRLMKLLERLAAEHGVPTSAGTLIDVSLTQADIASLIGSTRETVSSELSQLTRDGRIIMRGRKILMPNRG